MSPLAHRTKIVATIGPASDHPDTQVLLDDGLLELQVEAVEAPAVICRVVTGRILKSHKGVNLPSLTLRLPSMTEKDRQDLIFGVEQGVDIVSLSFVRQAQDVQELKALLAAQGATIPVLARIATDVEPETQYVNYPPVDLDDPHAIGEALNAIDQVLDLRCIVTFTETGHSAKLAAAERPRVPVVAITENPRVYHQLNLAWGVRPLLVDQLAGTMDGMFRQIEQCLVSADLTAPGDKVLIVGGLPMKQAGSTNFLKIHTIASA